MLKAYEFPTTFLWGAATAAYQVEGSPLADGAGPSIWHRFVAAGLVRTATPAMSPATNIGAMRRRRSDEQLGLNAYRFSIAWGRIFPSGHRPR